MQDLEFIKDLPLTIRVIYSGKNLSVREYMQMREGQAVTLEKLAGEPLDFFVNDRLLARGEIVVNNEKYAIRLTEIIGKDLGGKAMDLKSIVSELPEEEVQEEPAQTS